MPLRSGDRFGRYVIEELLGQGAMGEVYRAADTKLERQIALKLLHIARTEGDVGLTRAGATRMLREARAAALVDHPNAVAVFDVGELGGIPFLAMEYVEGENLRELIGKTDASIATRVLWLASVAAALAAAHKGGIVHQDVKPENVMVRQDGAVKVLDFGIARRLRIEEAETKAITIMTAQGPLLQVVDETGVAGTPAYMAPEQLLEKPIDGRTDQFAWGVFAYELLTGVLPWDLDSGILQLVSQILSKTPVSPRSRAPEIPEHVDAVILRAMAKAPAARFRSMEDVARALLEPPRPVTGQTGASTEITPAAVESTSTPAPRAARRGRWVAAAFAAIAIAVPFALRDRVLAVVRGASSAMSAVPAGATAPDRGSKMSADPEALASYRAGLQSMRDAAATSAYHAFDRATLRDPAFAAAHLRAALALPHADDAARAHVATAVKLRGDLGPHDRVLLNAIEPWARVPPDVDGTIERLRAAADDQNVDTLFQLCRVQSLGGDYRAAIQTCGTARERDVNLAAAWWLAGFDELLVGEDAEGVKSLEQCLDRSRGATSCLNDLLQLDSNEGRCEAALERARRANAIEPDQAAWLEEIGSFLLATGEAKETADEIFGKDLALLPADVRRVSEARIRTMSAAYQGDLDAARKELATWEVAVEARHDEVEHVGALVARIGLETESGHPSAVGAAARDYLARRAALTPAWFGDFRIVALVAQYRAGWSSHDELVRQRDAWLAEQRGRADREGPRGAARGATWVAAYASVAETPRDAQDALAVLSAYLPFPAARTRTVDQDVAIGETYLRAGRPGEAVPHLQRATNSCHVLLAPFDQARAAVLLGEALELVQKPREACAAYSKVVTRWKGSSVTPRAARSGARRTCRD